MLATKKFETWNIEKHALESLFADHAPATFRDAVALIYCAYGLLKGRTRFKYWGDKNKLWKQKLARVLNYYPNARFIHIVRDGRDVACSFRELSARNMHTLQYGPRLPDKIELIAEHWATNLTFIGDFLRNVRQERQVTVSYEHLVLSPRETLTGVTDFLQLEFADSMLDFAGRNRAESLEPAATMPWKQKLNDRLEKTNIGKYQRQLSAEEIALFEKHCGRLLNHYGYN